MSKIDEMSLLKRFEPILKFTKGERFFPYNVEDYVEKASLWVKKPKQPPEMIIAESELTLDVLGSLDLSGAGNVFYLQFISPLNLAKVAEFHFSELKAAFKKREFQPSYSRLVRVGYLARIVDAAYSLLLLLRGRVPGDLMAAAVVTFNQMLEFKRSFQYYARVVEQNGWIVLQYWYFYPFNNWRSGYNGANDHEADWEMVNVYCYQDKKGEVHPAWVAYASHNFQGDDLRRHWDDPELEKIDDHPVVYIAGGSHSSYFQRGEYMTELVLGFLKPLGTVIKRLQAFLNKNFSSSKASDDGENYQKVFTIPFIDYALADGLSIGFGCEESWAEPVILGPAEGWAMNYHGLWGYYAQDPFSGEDAPAGPRFNRDGSVRLAWFDPLAWSGLEKTTRPDAQAEALFELKMTTNTIFNKLQGEIQDLQNNLNQKGLELDIIRDLPHLKDEVMKIQNNLEDGRKLLIEKRTQLTVEQEKQAAIVKYTESLSQDRHPLSLRAHIKHAHRPQENINFRFNRLAEIWAAISIGIMMIAVVLLIMFASQYLVYGFGGLLLVLIGIEAAFRRRLVNLIHGFAVLLALIGFIILLTEYFRYFVLVVVMIIGLYMIILNLQELLTKK